MAMRYKGRRSILCFLFGHKRLLLPGQVHTAVNCGRCGEHIYWKTR